MRSDNGAPLLIQRPFAPAACCTEQRVAAEAVTWTPFLQQLRKRLKIMSVAYAALLLPKQENHRLPTFQTRSAFSSGQWPIVPCAHPCLPGIHLTIMSPSNWGLDRQYGDYVQGMLQEGMRVRLCVPTGPLCVGDEGIFVTNPTRCFRWHRTMMDQVPWHAVEILGVSDTGATAVNAARVRPQTCAVGLGASCTTLEAPCPVRHDVVHRVSATAAASPATDLALIGLRSMSTLFFILMQQTWRSASMQDARLLSSLISQAAALVGGMPDLALAASCLSSASFSDTIALTAK